jgi:hypothetical protein
VITLQSMRDGAIEAFWQTIRLKLQLFHSAVPKGTNATVAGDFIEELVRGFIRDWIQPCQLLRGTLHPFNVNPEYPEPGVPQIDGIVFDPRQGPPVIREGNFIVVHPQFCPGVIEIKKSDDKLRALEDRLTGLHRQFYRRGIMVNQSFTSVMGVVIHDPDPEGHSHPDWVAPNQSLHEIVYQGFCPIFILFKEVKPGVEYEPYEPAIEAMMSTIFSHGWAFDPRLIQFRREVHTGMMIRNATGGY